VELLTDWPERLVPGAELWIEGGDVPSLIVNVEHGTRTPVVYLDGIGSREAAEAVVGRYLEAPPVELEEGVYFWEDLVGLTVREPDGSEVGELVEVFRAGGNEVYRVVGARGERLVPALRSVVQRIDLDGGVMVVTPDDAEEIH